MRHLKKMPTLSRSLFIFFVITSIAHLSSTKLHLFRIIDDVKGALSIFSLIKFAENHNEIFEQQDDYNVIFENHHKPLSSVNLKIQNLNKNGDKHFIHKSNEYLDKDYEKLYQGYLVTYNDYKILFEVFGKIFNDYFGLLKEGKQTSFEIIGEDDEFDTISKKGDRNY